MANLVRWGQGQRPATSGGRASGQRWQGQRDDSSRTTSASLSTLAIWGRDDARADWPKSSVGWLD